MQEGLIPLFLILSVSLFFSRILHRFRIPWVIALIVAGIIIGPFGFKFVAPDATFNFLASLGLIFLLFMAGLEIKLSGIKQFWKDSVLIALISGFVPAIIGALIGLFFGYNIGAVILLGIIFMSSSFAVVVPILEEKKLLKTKIGQLTTSAIILQDILSLIILAVALQYLSPGSTLSLTWFILLFVGIFLLGGLFVWVIFRSYRFLAKIFISEEKFGFERELRFIFVILLGMVVVFELLGLHPMIGAFFAGLVLSGVITNPELKNKIFALSYGFFIPIFFVSIGMKTNINIFLETKGFWILTITILFGSLVTKFGSTWIAARLRHHTLKQSALVAATSIPQLTTTLAVVFVGQEMKILSSELVTAMIILSVITTLLAPILTKILIEHVKKDYFVTPPKTQTKTQTKI